ncbi:hypothetical protein D3C71_2220310 [compost metagenome]
MGLKNSLVLLNLALGILIAVVDLGGFHVYGWGTPLVKFERDTFETGVVIGCVLIER